jgi:hypothetical protein
MTFSVTVLGHGGAQDAFDRHVPLWRGLNSGTCVSIIISPEDDPLDTTRTWRSARHKLLGPSHRAGPGWAVRFLWLFETLQNTTDCSHHLIFEYDSVCLSPDVPAQTGLSAIPMANTDLARFLAPRFSPPPWLIDHHSLQAIRRVALKYPDVTEEGFGDRLMAAWAYLASVPILAFQPPGYADERIDIHDPAKMRALDQTLRRGGRLFHGFKDAETLEAAQKILSSL